MSYHSMRDILVEWKNWSLFPVDTNMKQLDESAALCFERDLHFKNKNGKH